MGLKPEASQPLDTHKLINVIILRPRKRSRMIKGALRYAVDALGVCVPSATEPCFICVAGGVWEAL